MNKTEKERIIQELEEKFSKASASVFMEFKGLNVQNMEELRKRSRSAKLEFQVIKNTLAIRAFKALNREDTGTFFVGPTAVAFGWDDPITPIKVLTEYVKDNPQLVLKGGMVEGALISTDKLSALASLPPREILLSKMLGSLQSPLSGLMNVLQGPIAGLLNCLKALEKQKA